jgi:cell division protease FtsH
MSEKLGPIVFGEKEELIFLGREISEQRNYGDEVARQIDEEVRRFASEAYENAIQILITNRSVVDDMANALLEFETVDGEQLAELLSRVKPLTIDMTRQSTNGRHASESKPSLPPPPATA